MRRFHTFGFFVAVGLLAVQAAPALAQCCHGRMGGGQQTAMQMPFNQNMSQTRTGLSMGMQTPFNQGMTQMRTGMQNPYQQAMMQQYQQAMLQQAMLQQAMMQQYYAKMALQNQYALAQAQMQNARNGIPYTTQVAALSGQ